LFPSPAPPLDEEPEPVPVPVELPPVELLGVPPPGVAPPDCEDAGAVLSSVPPEDELPEESPVEAPESPEESLGAVVVELVDVVVLAAATVVDPPAGTVSCGTPAALELPEPPPPPPQAARPPDSAKPATSAVRDATIDRLRLRVLLEFGDITTPSARLATAERLHPPAAIRAVVEVLLGELIAPVAETQVLDRPRKL
jgi:hypothetical protein